MVGKMLALSIRGICPERKHIGKDNETLVVGLVLEHLIPETTLLRTAL